MAQVPVYIQNYNPTIKGVQNFDPHADAKVLRNAMKGAGTDEKAIVKILTTRSNQQIQQIRQAYAQDFEGKDLIRNIKDEVGGKFEDAAIALLLPRADFDAKSLNEAMKGMGTNENTLIEIICTRTSDQLTAIARSYDRLYDKALAEIVKSEVGGDLQKLLLDCLACKRERDTKEVNEKKAHDDANLLYQAGEKKWGTDENKFIEILTTRSFSQIHEINNQYNKLSKNTLEAAIKSEMSGDLATALCTIVEYSRDPAGCWARLLSEAMKGIGTDDKKLIRIMVTRAEIDLKSVRDVFGDRYGKGKTLESWIKSDTAGEYEHVLSSLLLGNEQQ